MISQLKSWIVGICSTIFFITAVEMILPNNSLKKYAKFVLGLILVSALMNPIVKLFDKNFDIKIHTNNIFNEVEENEYKKDTSVYKDRNIENTLDNFENNLEKVCMEKLQEKYPSTNFKVKTKASFNEKKGIFEIENINIGIKEGKIENIKKVEVSLKDKEPDNTERVEKEVEDNIKDYLGSLFKIDKKLIFVYKL